jgi:HAD superfamily hydrolase (TIGR01459 family)
MQFEGARAFADRYDAFAVDIWGVVHNSIEPYPGVIDCLRCLRSAGKQVVLLSNVPRVAERVTQQLEGLGVPRDAYDRIISSGQVAREALKQREDPWHARLGRRFFHLGPEHNSGLIEDCGYDRAATLAEADFVLATGLFDEANDTLASYQPLLDQARSRDLPFICVNPDLSVMRGDRFVLSPGSLAHAYEALGGDVCYHGKPRPGIYQACFRSLGGMAAGRVLAVGDTLRTDIAGAVAAGMDAVLVAGGLHAADFLSGKDGPVDPSRVREACTRENTWPIGVLKTLVY